MNLEEKEFLFIKKIFDNNGDRKITDIKQEIFGSITLSPLDENIYVFDFWVGDLKITNLRKKEDYYQFFIDDVAFTTRYKPSGQSIIYKLIRLYEMQEEEIKKRNLAIEHERKQYIIKKFLGW